MTATTVNAPQTWVDSKRYGWLISILPMLLPLLAIGYASSYENDLLWWIGPMIVFILIPVLDVFWGEDTSNPPESVVRELEKQKYYRYAVYAAIVLEMISFVVASYVAASWNLPWHAYLGLAVTTAMMTGISINTAHELGHKNDLLERWLARIGLAPTWYGHFVVEHNYGHHKRVATPEDPATSRFGETFWAFYPRCVTGSFRSAWHIEKERLERRGLPVWSIQNENLQAWAVSLVLWAGLVAWLGLAVVPFLLIQAIYGSSLLETVNYLEHYGLKRRKRADGSYERTAPEHSWNSNHVVTNIFLYQLQRHSDHHANPTRSYQALRHFEEAPQLPAGYAPMILAAYVPPLWFSIMNKRVFKHYNGDLSRVSVHPGKEAYARAEFDRLSREA